MVSLAQLTRPAGVRFTLLAAFGLFLSACEVSGPPPGPGPGPGPWPGGPQVCPRIYAPVCATDRGRERTFPNACEARADGWRVRHDGECRRGRPDRPDRPDWSDRPDRPDRPQACPMIYQPVCGRIGRRTQVYSNDCMLRAEGARRVPMRECRR